VDKTLRADIEAIEAELEKAQDVEYARERQRQAEDSPGLREIEI
jgi:hypothetical protein